MKKATSPAHRELPRAIAERMQSSSRPVRSDADQMLRDIAVVLKLTQRVRAEILDDQTAGFSLSAR